VLKKSRTQQEIIKTPGVTAADYRLTSCDLFYMFMTIHMVLLVSVYDQRRRLYISARLCDL